MKAIIAGPDEDGLGDALADRDVDVSRIEIANRPALEEAGLHEADLLVLTDVADATAIPIARDLTEDLRIVVYAEESLPEFASAQEVMALDPELLSPETVAEELV